LAALAELPSDWTMMHFAETTMTVLVTPSEDVPGQWVAHCLNIDVVTQGDSVQHAFMMVKEAVLQVVLDDIAHGLDPLERPRASEDLWELVTTTLREGCPVPAIEDQRRITAAIGALHVRVPRDALPERARPAVPEVDMLPPAWQIAAVQQMRDSRPHC
jgi:hypothetical protein